MNQILNSGVDPSECSNYCLYAALINNNKSIIRRLLEDSRVDPSVNDNYAIGVIAENGTIDLVKKLLGDSRIDPSKIDGLIGFAARGGHYNVVKLLLEDGRADPTGWGNFAMLVAAEKGHLDIIKLLFEDERINLLKNDIDKVIGEGFRNNHYEIVQFLQNIKNASNACSKTD